METIFVLFFSGDEKPSSIKVPRPLPPNWSMLEKTCEHTSRTQKETRTVKSYELQWIHYDHIKAEAVYVHGTSPTTIAQWLSERDRSEKAKQ